MKLPPIIDTTYGLHSCRLLIVTSNEFGQESEFLQRMRELCQGAGHWELDACFSLEASFNQLSSRCYDVVLIDGSESLPLSESLQAIQERQPAVVVIAFAENIKQDEYAALFEGGLQDLLTPEHLMTPVLKSSILNAVSRQRLVTHLKSKNSILQRRLEDQVGYLKKVINGTHDGVIIIDQQGIVRLANPAAVDLFDRNQGELLGSYFGYPLANERPIELTIESQKRGLLTAEMRVARIEWDDRIAYLATVHDISRYKNQAETFKASEEAAIRSSRLKSEFLANMSHEIRTPLNGVLGMVQLLNLTKLQPYQQELLGTVQASGDHLLVLINDILDMSKIEAGKLVLDIAAFQIEDLIREVMAIHSPAANMKRLCLICMVEPGVPETIFGDKVRLRQILSNLVGNAVKFTDEGDVTLKVTRSASATSNHCIVGFQVSDTGPGIPSDRISELFQPFNQVHSDTSKGGTGLGLSISKRLVNLMKGEIGVSSSPGMGCTFRFDIPFESSVANGVILQASGQTTAIDLLSPSEGRRLQLVHGLNTLGVEIDSTAQDGITIIDLCTQSLAKQKEFVAERDRLLDEGQSVIQLCYLNDTLSSDVVHPCLWTIHSPFNLKDVVFLLEGISKGGTEHSFREVNPAKAVLSQELPKTRSEYRGTILVAEDNIVNQQVALRFLHHLGFETELVGNGREAVAAVSQKTYAAVLMDYRMPILDGVQATIMIRALESKDRRVPIIAFTANAQEMDRRACVAAGMDGFLTKPIRISELQAELSRVLPDAFDEASLPPVAISKGTDILDHSIIQELVDMGIEDGDPNFPGELLHLYLEVSAARIKDLHLSLENHDLKALHAHAHSLKGSSANVGARRLTDYCRKMELTDLGNLAAVKSLLSDLENAFDETRFQLSQIVPPLSVTKPILSVLN